MKIAIASGKGGTGKSTISTNLVYLLSKKHDNIAIVDCDVEEPNCHIFLKPEFHYEENSYVEIPIIDEEKCVKCGKCNEVCQFNAIAQIKDKILIFDELCHGCKSCMVNCKNNAIKTKKKIIGTVNVGKCQNFDFIQGITKIGEAITPPTIKLAKKLSNDKNYSIEIIDCPPGTSCPLINSIDGVDMVILVTEPTPFGLYDLKLAVDVMKKLNLPFYVVINRSCENDKIIESWAEKENIKIITKIPDCKDIMKTYSRGELITEKLKDFEKYFNPLINLIEEKI